MTGEGFRRGQGPFPFCLRQGIFAVPGSPAILTGVRAGLSLNKAS